MARRLTCLALGIALALGACTTSASPAPTATPELTPAPTAAPPSAAPTAAASNLPAAELYTEIRSEVEAIRGLSPTAPVEPVTIDATQLAQNLAREFDATHTAKDLRDSEDELITLGLLPPGTSLRDVTLAFEAGQVAGYYSPEQDELFVVSRSGAIGPVDESTYAHEFTHQLQDQHIDLGALGIDTPDQSDRSLARLALVEGDATSVQTTWMTKYLTAAELGQVFAAGLDPAALEAFNNAPAYLQQTSLFPYQEGLAFVQRLIANGGYPAVDAAFADPPDSTEQVLHPDKYVTREAPVAVKLPADLAARFGPGWSVAVQDTLGELILRIWLTEGGVPPGTARVAAAGWGGDRLGLLRGPDGLVAVQLETTWDTTADADEFAAAALTAATAFGGLVDHPVGTRTVSIVLGAFPHTSPAQTP